MKKRRDLCLSFSLWLERLGGQTKIRALSQRPHPGLGPVHQDQTKTSGCSPDAHHQSPDWDAVTSIPQGGRYGKKNIPERVKEELPLVLEARTSVGDPAQGGPVHLPGRVRILRMETERRAFVIGQEVHRIEEVKVVLERWTCARPFSRTRWASGCLRNKRARHVGQVPVHPSETIIQPYAYVILGGSCQRTT